MIRFEPFTEYTEVWYSPMINDFFIYSHPSLFDFPSLESSDGHCLITLRQILAIDKHLIFIGEL